MSQTPPPFINPDDFAPVKGRANQYFCQVCLPPGRTKGQAMKLAAALRHERENAKHLEKVKEKIRDDWNYNPPCDWGPIPLPEGSNAWEQSYPVDRAEEFIVYWRDNIAAGERGEPLKSMDSFIDDYNKKYQDWLDGWYTGEAQKVEEAKGGGDEEAEEEEGGEEGEWNGVPGTWYEGDSFLPRDDGFNSVHHFAMGRAEDNWYKQQKQQAWPPCPPDPNTVWFKPEGTREMLLGWGFKPEEIPVLQASDATSPSQPQETSPLAKKGGRKNARNNGVGRGNGGARKQGAGIVEGATGRANARRGKKAKIH